MWENPNTFLRPRGQNQPTKVSNSDWNALEKCEQGHRFWTFNCIFIHLTAFPTDKNYSMSINTAK